MNAKVERYLDGLVNEMEVWPVSVTEWEEISNLLKKLEVIGLMDKDERETWESSFSDILYKPIGILEISTRARNCLERAGIRTCKQVREVILNRSPSGKKFLELRNLGTVTASEILEHCIQKGIVQIEEVADMRKDPKWCRVMLRLPCKVLRSPGNY